MEKNRQRAGIPFRGNFELRPLGVAMGNAAGSFHRNYLTDGPDSTLRTSPPGLVSCAGTMDG